MKYFIEKTFVICLLMATLPVIDGVFRNLELPIEILPTAMAACEIDEYGNEINCDGGGGSGGGDACLAGQILAKPCGVTRTFPCPVYECNWLGFNCQLTIEWVFYCEVVPGMTVVCGYGNVSPNCPS